MSNNIISKIVGIVGAPNVIEVPSEMSKYLKGNGKPVAVVLPGSTTEVSEIVKLANAEKVKIAVGGSVVNSSGLDGGIALVLSRMNKVLEIDHENLVVTVQPGLSHKEFLSVVEEAGLYFPPEPVNVHTSSIGGCFAIGDADSKSFQYGPTRTYLLGFEMVLPTGEVLDIGNKCIKNVSGYDFIHFAVGSQGTLGIFTKLLVKLLPKPQANKAVVASFPDIHKAIAAFQTIIGRNIHTTRLNLINSGLAKDVLAGAQGHLALVDLEGFKESSSNMAKEIAAVFTLGGASEVKIIEEKQEYENLINGWLGLRAKLNEIPGRVLEFAVGPMKMPPAIKKLEELIGDLGNYPGVIVEGLLGNVRLLLPEGTDKLSLARKINAMAISFGGNVTGLLGTKLRCEYYNDAEMWQETSNLLNEIRRQFDPQGILNPGISLSL